MTATRTTAIRCDVRGCSAIYEDDGSLPPFVVRRHAALVGWRGRGQTDFCPRHARTKGARR